MIYETTPQRVGLAGDWHGDLPWALAALAEFAADGITTILHLGDFGVSAQNPSYLRRIADALEANGQVLLVTLGNHEDYVHLASMPRVEGDSLYSGAHMLSGPRLLAAFRGQRFSLGGVSFLSLGGANSIDRFSRTPNVSWWAEEQISFGDQLRALEGGEADVMLTHDAPSVAPLVFGNGGWSRAALAYAQGSREALQPVADGVRPRILFHGHHHRFYSQLVDRSLDDGSTYTTRYVGLGMNGDVDHNLVVLHLKTQQITTLRVSGPSAEKPPVETVPRGWGPYGVSAE